MKRADIILLLCLLIGITLILLGCEATRDNPLDPSSPMYKDPPEPDKATDFQTFRIMTRHIAETEPIPPQKYMDIEAELYDADGINEVHIEIADTLRFNMLYDSQRQVWFYTYYPELDGKELHEFQGSSFYLYVYDNRGFVRKSWRESITRIISPPPSLESPKRDTSTVTTDTWLVWSKRLEGYDHYYEVEVTTINGTTEFYRNNLAPLEILPNSTAFESTQVSPNLSLGVEYLWYVRVWDNLGNLSESSTVLFEVNAESGGTISN